MQKSEPAISDALNTLKTQKKNLCLKKFDAKKVSNFFDCLNTFYVSVEMCTKIHIVYTMYTTIL